MYAVVEHYKAVFSEWGRREEEKEKGGGDGERRRRQNMRIYE